MTKQHNKGRIFSLLLALALAASAAGCGKKQETAAAAETAEMQPEIVSADMLEPTPTPEATTEELKNLQEAIEQNPDSVAWLVVPGTDTNEVVVQYTDNDYYLRRNALGESDVWGCTFSDYVNNLSSRELLHPNSILYGHSHNSEDVTQPQFTQLFKYTDIDFLKQNPAFYLYLPDGDKLTFQVAAVFYTDIGFDYINPFPDESYYTTVQNKSEYVISNVSISAEDQLMTLSTCSYKYDVNNTHNHRFVVLGKLLPEGEEPVTPEVTANPSPERPQQ